MSSLKAYAESIDEALDIVGNYLKEDMLTGKEIKECLVIIKKMMVDMSFDNSVEAFTLWDALGLSEKRSENPMLEKIYQMVGRTVFVKEE